MPLQEQRLPQQPTPEHPYVQKPRHRYQHRDKHSFSEGSTGNSEERGRSKTRGGTLKADENVDRRSPPMDTVPTQSCSMESAPSSEMSEAGTEIIIPQRWQAGGPPYAAHSFKAGSHTFTVDTKYNLIRVIGSGAYGVVISSLDTSTNTKVAIKMVPKAFNDEIDAKRILREIKLLKHFRHENIIGIVDMMPPLVRNVEDFHDVYIVADLMETDLHRIIYSKQSLTVDHVQYFIYQILRALKYIHSANVLHRDLKPSNLLVNSNCDLKICDLGLARGVLPDDEDINSQVGGSMLLTEYVVTRWYRAPEIMLACHEYTKPIDVWSVGCIFAELLARKPYFPGEDYIDQLTIISEKLGKVSEEDLDFVTSEKAKRFMRRLPDKSPQPLSRQFPNTPPDALDLLQRMLTVHPRKRITVSDALKHPFLAALHSPDDEPVADRPFDFGFEDDDLHRVRLQELIWEEIGSFRPGCMPVPPRKDGTRAPTRKTARRLHHV
eukprot:CAMPEP_0172499648 /NCGR_PEP_ID=MMETSP1066-20121228/129164_1 /TAXON_ID=671091 /ORGANISM="Coscinodiscus wailesii, Strain CCMP2513" /LENGTH=492 /DNA_ID=CAMNT_0013273507 /DNA_START=546 /DNA_END=2024 /DNA_ORIENTATION=-